MKSKPTIRDIAHACGVSRTSVSAALRGAEGVSEAVRHKIQKVADEMGYVRDPKVAQVMSHIARSGETKALQRIAIVSAPELKEAPPWDGNGLLHRFYLGVKRRAEQLGCGFEAFWMAEPNMTRKRLAQIMYSRGIDGMVLMLDYGKDPTVIEFEYDKFAVSVIGTSLKWPHLYSAEGNLHQGMLLAMRQAQNYGYKRPGLMIRQGESQRGDHSWEAGYYFARSRLPEQDRIPVCLFERDDTSSISEWYEKNQPDVIIGHQPPGIRLLGEYGISVPEDVAFIALEMHESDSEIAGINIHPESIGEKAVDLLTAQFRRNQTGLPDDPQTVLVDCEWHDGKTLPYIAKK